jgi:secreted PhoX family phosphatase
MKTKITRRSLFGQAAAVAAGFAGLKAMEQRGYAQATGFGPLVADPAKLLDLPKGFKYTMFSNTGEMMDDGFRVPGAHDGMAAFPGPNGLTVLVRNHEMGVAAAGSSGSPYVNAAQYNGMDKTKVYDVGTVNPALGGTTNVLYDTQLKKCVGHFLSLTGTIRNCAGGPTPWGSWITCEETGLRAGQSSGGTVLAKDHGWVFDVPAAATPGWVLPVPQKALGRFSHEALAVNPNNGIIYETEDQGNSAFYRFVPDTQANTKDSLLSGKLQALKIIGFTNPTQNTNNRSAPNFPVGTPFDVEWVDLTDVESPGDNLRTQAQGKGAAIFSRGEGCWWGNNAIYFACTDGGPSSLGQIFKYTPSPFEGTAAEATNRGKLELFIQPTSANQFAAPDNIAIGPNGDVIICEDGSGDEFVHGVTTAGAVYKIARNAAGDSEFAGACWSPDGSTLFVNVQSPGRTFAITGPWHRRVA